MGSPWGSPRGWFGPKLRGPNVVPGGPISAAVNPVGARRNGARARAQTGQGGENGSRVDRAGGLRREDG